MDGTGRVESGTETESQSDAGSQNRAYKAYTRIRVQSYAQLSEKKQFLEVPFSQTHSLSRSKYKG